MSAIAKAELLRLSVSERIQLAEDLWDSIVDHPDQVPVTEAQKTELDRRLKAYAKDRNGGSPWPAVRKRILKRH